MKNGSRITAILVILLIIGGIIGAGIWWVQWNKQRDASDAATTTTGQSIPQADLDNPNSLQVVVNKQRPLNPTDFMPTDLTVPSVPLRVPGHESMQLREPAARALESMFADAKAQGLSLMVSSGFRSYAYQVGLYNGYVRSIGQAAADTQSARPGYSEHQTGLAVDVEPVSQQCELEACFADTPEGAWVAAHAHEYGFIIRYPQNKEAVTGYIFEPWHLRYVGREVAQAMHDNNIDTLETFFNLPPAPTYN